MLRALNVSDAKFSEIEQARRQAPYVNNPGTLPTTQGLGIEYTSRTFRVEAQGIIDGKVRARLTAVVQVRPDASGPNMAVLEWSGLH